MLESLIMILSWQGPCNVGMYLTVHTPGSVQVMLQCTCIGDVDLLTGNMAARARRELMGVAEEKGSIQTMPIGSNIFSSPLLQRPVVPYMRTKKEKLNLFHGLQPSSISVPTYSCAQPTVKNNS